MRHKTTPPSHADHVNLTPVEAAALLRRSPTTLERWRRLRVGPPFFRVCGRPLYNAQDVERWRAAQEESRIERGPRPRASTPPA